MDADDTARIALITGGARRLGAAIALRLHADGHDVLLHARRSRAEAEALAQRCNALRADSARCVFADLDDPSAPAQLIAAARDWRNRLDLLVNNASSFAPSPVGQITAAHWDELVGSNLRAPLFLSQAAAPLLRASGGAIVNLIDSNLDTGLRDHAVYLAAKAGLASLTRSLALELAPEVRVNGVAPGAILWPEPAPPAAAQAALLRTVPLGRLGDPADIADAVAFLGAAAYITGEVITVDGGRRLTPAG